MAGGANRNITVRLLADASQYTATMAKAGDNAGKVATELEKTGSKTGLITTGLAAAGAAATAFGVMAVKTAAEFDASMSTVQANTGATADELNQLRQAAIDAGASTVYSASEAADGINELGKAGVSTADILSGGLSGALNLAASDGMEVAEASELMASTLAQFNLQGSDAGKVADALAAGAGKAQGSARDLGYALQQAGMVANSYGVSMEETTGALTAFANAGMIGSDAGTSLKTMLIALANPSDKAANLMNELGINAFDAQGNFIGLANLAGVLQTQMSGLTQEQRNQALATIFGSDAIRAANVLYNEGAQGIDEWTRKVSDSGYAAEQAAAKNNNLKGDLENLSGSVESLMIQIGEGAQGPLRSTVQMLDTLVDAFSSLPAPVQQTIVVLTAAAGGMVAIHKAATPLNTSTGRLAQTFGQMIDPLQRINTAWPQLKAGFSTLGSTFAASFQSLRSGTPVIGASMAAMNGLKSVGSGLVSLMGGPWGIAFAVAAGALTHWAQQAQEAKAAADSVQSALESTGSATEALVKQTQDMTVGDGLLGWFQQVSVGAKTVPELLDKVGLSIADLVGAAQGNADALQHVNDVIDQLGQGDPHGQAAAQANALRQALDELTDANNRGSEAAKQKSDAMSELTGSTGENTAATGENAAAAQKSIDAESVLADQFGATKDAVDETSAALAEVIDALSTYYGFALDSSNASIALEESFDKASEAVTKNGRTLDINTEKGRANQSALNDVAEAAQKAMLAHAKNGESVDQLVPIVQKARDEYIQLAQRMGMSGEDAAKAADKYGLNVDRLKELVDKAGAGQQANGQLATSFKEPAKQADVAKAHVDEFGRVVMNLPKTHGVNIVVNDLTGAIWSVRQLGDQIDMLQSKTVTIRTNKVTEESTIRSTRGSLTGRPGAATGGLYTGMGFALRGYADGGMVEGLVTGPGTGASDSILLANAKLSRGEFVANAKAVAYYGAGLFDRLNRRGIPREGLVRPAPNTMPQTPSVTTRDERRYTVSLQVTGTPDPEVTARKTFEYLRSRIPGGGL